MSEKFWVNAAGISLPISWLLCTGMCYACPRKQAKYKIESLLSLPEGAIQTEEDHKIVLGILEKHLPLLLETELRDMIFLRFGFAKAITART